MLPTKSVTLAMLIAASLGLSGCIASAGSPWDQDDCDDASTQDHGHSHDYEYEYEYEYEYDDEHGNHYEYDYEYEYEYAYDDDAEHEHEAADGCPEELTPYDEDQDDAASDAGHEAHEAQDASQDAAEGHHDVWDGRAVGPTSFHQTVETTEETELLVISADWTRVGSVRIDLENPEGETIAYDAGSGYHHTTDDSWALVEQPGPGTWTLTFTVYGYLDYHIEATY